MSNQQPPRRQQEQPPQTKRNPFNFLFLLLGLLALFLIWQNVINSGPKPQDISLTQFRTAIDVQNGFSGNYIHAIAHQQGGSFYILMRPNGTTTQEQIKAFNQSEAATNFRNDPSKHATHRIFITDISLINDLVTSQLDAAAAANALTADSATEIDVRPSIPIATNIWNIVFNLLPYLFLAFVAIIFWRMMSNRGGISGIGKNRATVVWDSPIRFADVAGIEEEKAEVEEIVQFLRHPGKFLDLGARIPKGFLLVGAPGTGKTMLAKAIAGEARVPFFSVSGSDFSEMLVGVGPSRMRDLFEQAKLNHPCVIFIDEIDSIARMRGVSSSGVAEEAEQTLNQLLVQMDGFNKSEGVIVLAATNRPDVLDQALLRPGRFDRQIVIQTPDVSGREKILAVHSRHKPLSADVDLKRVAQIISGFTGADIENLLNESAIIAAKKGRKKITMADITEGINKVLLGPQKRSRIITEEDKKITAYHEAGHTVVAYTLQPRQTVQEVSIIPRGMAAGYMLTTDKDDITSHKSRSFLKNQLAVFLGGRAAESVFLGEICTGAHSDLKGATALAEKMVTSFGMSDKLGPLFYGRHEEAMMRAYSDKNISDNLQTTIDAEVRELVMEAQTRATELMKKYAKNIEVMVEILLERETIYAEDIALIMEGKSKKAVLEAIEARLEKSRAIEKREKIESELEGFEDQVSLARQVAQSHLNAKLWDEEQIALLEQNIALAKKAIEDGIKLSHYPTVDNLHEYAKLVQVSRGKAQQGAKVPDEIKPMATEEEGATQNGKS